MNGFQNGFDIGYEGPTARADNSENIPLMVGDKYELWKKLMKEVKLKRYAGPYAEIPFAQYVQSPIGLVPKAGNQTRQIFHLSYNFPKSGFKSINYYIPADKCSVKYKDLDFAIKCILDMLQSEGNDNSLVYLSKTDVQSAFRLLPLASKCYSLLVMKAKHPITNEVKYFVEKCLSFGSSISCFHFQRFSDALKHIVEVKTGTTLRVTNYLDDFLFIGTSKRVCNALMRCFLDICEEIGVPVAPEKTVWATLELTFLGIDLDGKTHALKVPQDKKLKAINMLKLMISKKKATVRQIQQLSGTLNFINKAVVPGRAFTRRMYAKYSEIESNKTPLKQYHHVKLDDKF